MNDSSTCSFDGCNRPMKAKSLCHPHYRQSWKGQALKPLTASPGQRFECSFSGCENHAKGLGYCNAHYRQFKTRGNEDLLTPLYATRRPAGGVVARDEDGNKLCTKCSAWKQPGDFARSNSRVDGFEPWCRECKKEDGLTSQQRAMKRREARFNITHEQFLAMLEMQGNGCAICRTQEPGGHGWCIDHDHACCDTPSKSCGKCVRAVLCTRCNSALGLVLENKETLRAMARYIDAHKSDTADMTDD